MVEQAEPTGTFKLYFEEIPAHDDDGDDAFSPDGQIDGGVAHSTNQPATNKIFGDTTPNTAPNSVCETESQVEKIKLEGGGEIQSVNLGEHGLGEQEEHEHPNTTNIPSQRKQTFAGGELKSGNVHSITSERLSQSTHIHSHPPKTNQSPEAAGSSAMFHCKQDIFVFGGANRHQEHFNCLWRFALDTQEWCVVNIAISNDTVTSSNRTVSTETNGHKTCIGKSTTSRDSPSPRSGHTLCRVGSTSALLFGGMNMSVGRCENDLYLLQVHVSGDRNLARWTKLARSSDIDDKSEHVPGGDRIVNVIGEPPQARSEHTMTLVSNGVAIMYGGSHPDQGPMSDVFALEFSLGHEEVTAATTDCLAHEGVPERSTNANTNRNNNDINESNVCSNVPISEGCVISCEANNAPQEAHVFIEEVRKEKKQKLLTIRWSRIRCQGIPPCARELHSAVLWWPPHYHQRNQSTDATNMRRHENENQKMKEEEEEEEESREKITWKFQLNPNETYQVTTSRSRDQLTAAQNGEHNGNKLEEIGFEANEVPSIMCIEQAAALKTKGNGYFLNGKLKKAVEVYEVAAKLNCNDHTVAGNLSACFLKMNEPHQALTAAMAAIRAKPTWGKGYMREASALSALGHIPEAHSANMAALELASSDVERNAFSKVLALSTDALRQIENKQGGSEEGRNRSTLELELGKSHREAPFLVVYGGRGGASGGVLSDVVMLDLENKRWLSHVETNEARCGHSTVVNPAGQLVSFGGAGKGFEMQNSASVMDLICQTKHQCELAPKSNNNNNNDNNNNKQQQPIARDDMPTQRFAHAGCALHSDNKTKVESAFLDNIDKAEVQDSSLLSGSSWGMFVFGGSNRETELDDLWVLRSL